MQRPQSRFGPLVARFSVGTVLLVLFLLAGSLLVGFVRLAWLEHRINQDINRQVALNDAQRARNLALQGQADYSGSDAAVEQAARERLGMAREGETVLRPEIIAAPTPSVVPAVPAPLAVATPAAVGNAIVGNARGWWVGVSGRQE